MRLIVQAMNVHCGGGAVLLNALLSSLSCSSARPTLFLDARMPVPEDVREKATIIFVRHTVWHRWKAECQLARCATDDAVVLCFGNLPPLFRCRSKVVLFLHNRYLVGHSDIGSFPLKVRTRIAVERVWLKRFCKNADAIVVQSSSMKRDVKDHLGVDADILPFVGSSQPSLEDVGQDHDLNEKRFDFIYVASGEPHKNHKKLIEAWVLLANEELRPILCITLDEESNQSLCRWIYDLRDKHRLGIVNVGSISRDDLLRRYSESKALIYPSLMESFGLPLIEARSCGLPIIACETDYVRDVVCPEETFDPSSALSVARAVRRFMGRDGKPLPLVEPETFIEFCLNTEGR